MTTWVLLLTRVYLGHHWLTVVITANRLMITLGRVGPLERTDPAEAR